MLSSCGYIRRNSLKARPPAMKRTDPYYPGYDRRYDDLSEEQIPLTESLLDCMERGKRIEQRLIAYAYAYASRVGVSRSC